MHFNWQDISVRAYRVFQQVFLQLSLFWHPIALKSNLNYELNKALKKRMNSCHFYRNFELLRQRFWLLMNPC